MTIYPAIDIKGGRAVRLTQGRADQETVYAENPADVAKQFRAAGRAKLFRHVGRILGVDRFLVGATLREPHGAAALDVDGGINGHSQKRFAPHSEGARLKPCRLTKSPLFSPNCSTRARPPATNRKPRRFSTAM